MFTLGALLLFFVFLPISCLCFLVGIIAFCLSLRQRKGYGYSLLFLALGLPGISVAYTIAYNSHLIGVSLPPLRFIADIVAELFGGKSIPGGP